MAVTVIFCVHVAICVGIDTVRYSAMSGEHPVSLLPRAGA